jgi:hypothetical protein
MCSAVHVPILLFCTGYPFCDMVLPLPPRLSVTFLQHPTTRSMIASGSLLLIDLLYHMCRLQRTYWIVAPLPVSPTELTPYLGSTDLLPRPIVCMDVHQAVGSFPDSLQQIRSNICIFVVHVDLSYYLHVLNKHALHHKPVRDFLLGVVTTLIMTQPYRVEYHHQSPSRCKGR